MSIDIADIKFIRENIPSVTIGYRNADYICDGVDDNVQIKEAIDFLHSRYDGGEIIVMKGLYNFGSAVIIDASNITIRGEGNATRFYVQDNANVLGAFVISGTGVIRCKLRNFSIDGNKENQSNGDGIYVDTPWLNGNFDPNHIFEDIYIKNCKNNGFEVKQSSDTRVLHLIRVRVRGSDGNNFYMPQPSCSDCVFDDCISETSSLNGFYMGGVNSHFINCKSFYCGSNGGNNHGFYIAGYNNFFDSCEAQDNYQSGFYTQNDGDATYGAQYCTFNNCIADSNGQNGGTVYACGFQLIDVTGWQIIGGLAMTRPYPDFTQRIGISIEGTATLNRVIGLMGEGNSSGLYSDTSNGTNYTSTSPPVLATGTGKTVDNIITVLQGLGIVTQS